MESLFTHSYAEIAEMLGLEKTFQAKIIYQNLIKGVSDFNSMTSLPKALRDRLSSAYGSALSSKAIRRDDDGDAVKLAVLLEDESIIECVRLSDGKGRYTACLSSQVGCAMGCAFCKTGTMGLVRNLTAGEIVEQLVHLESLGERISHIVYMGMGEALTNFTALIDSAEEIHREDGFGISFRKMTISTCGFVPGIRKLAELELPIRLAVSLVSADDEVRSRIMRINRTHPLAELKKAISSYQHHQDRRITLEYCLLSGVNTDKESADKLKAFTRSLDAVVNIIPWNPVPDLEFKTPSETEIRKFESYLKAAGIPYTIRREKGRGISGACGQLASETTRKS